MPAIDRHSPGEFCWVEVVTTDQPAAQSFYGQIVGWSAENIPVASNEVYTIYQLGGRHAAAACTIRPEQLQHGVPPHWGLYIAVQSADASAARAAEMGGTVLAGPIDVGEA